MWPLERWIGKTSNRHTCQTGQCFEARKDCDATFRTEERLILPAGGAPLRPRAESALNPYGPIGKEGRVTETAAGAPLAIEARTSVDDLRLSRGADA
jgi:hypothetical protein